MGKVRGSGTGRYPRSTMGSWDKGRQKGQGGRGRHNGVRLGMGEGNGGVIGMAGRSGSGEPSPTAVPPKVHGKEGKARAPVVWQVLRNHR